MDFSIQRCASSVVIRSGGDESFKGSVSSSDCVAKIDNNATVMAVHINNNKPLTFGVDRILATSPTMAPIKDRSSDMVYLSQMDLPLGYVNHGPPQPVSPPGRIYYPNLHPRDLSRDARDSRLIRPQAIRIAVEDRGGSAGGGN